MTLVTYIKDLLYRYDCVIVPDFGGFITNKISAQIDITSNTFHPPSKQLSFNHHLTHNDGLLANYISSVENISFEQANHKIVKTVGLWNQQIKAGPLELKSIGSLELNENNQLIFDPKSDVNYLPSSFGLSSVQSSSIERIQEKVIPLIPSLEQQEKKGIPAFIKYAATAAIALTFLGYGAWNSHQNKQYEQKLISQQKQLNEKIQAATFVINTPLPTIELSVEKDIPRPYHVVAGAFQFQINAQKKVEQLKAKGFDAYVLGKNQWGLIQVAYASFYKKTDAFKSLASVRKTDSKDAWLLVKKFY